jgi:sodium-dependent dicarboxylate transporter 2/3/5
MLSPFALAFLMVYVTVLLSNFMSHTAAANILVPLVVTMAPGFEATLAIAVAVGASSAMCLPVSTPPNAMVFATGRLQTWDLVRVGLAVGVFCPLIALGWMWLYLAKVLS